MQERELIPHELVVLRYFREAKRIDFNGLEGAAKSSFEKIPSYPILTTPRGHIGQCGVALTWSTD